MTYFIKKKNILYICLTLLFISIAGFRLLGWANDTANYYEMVVYQDELRLATKEFFFRLIIFLNDFIFNSNFTVFLLIFAFLGVSIKMYVFVKYSKIVMLSVILYFLTYFWLHEYIQIRAGVATGIFLLTIKDLSEGNAKKYFFKVFFAIMFHWSSILLIPLYFFIKYLNLRTFMFLPLISIVIYETGFNLNLIIASILTFTGINENLFKMYAGFKHDINVFNTLSILYILLFSIITIMLFNYRKLFSDYEIVLYKVFSFSISLFFFSSLLNAPVVAFRLLEYFNIILLLLLPSIVSKFKQKKLVSILSIIYFGIFSYYLFTKVIEFNV